MPNILWDLYDFTVGVTEKLSCELLLNTFSEHCFEQVNLRSTQNGKFLDIIATNRPDLVNDVTVETGASDHYAFIVTMVTKVNGLVKKARRVFVLERINKQLLASHLRNEWTSSRSSLVDEEELWAKFKCIANRGLEKYVPTKWIIMGKPTMF